jgi:hypothetical protein
MRESGYRSGEPERNMTNGSRHDYVMEAETGSYRLTGGIANLIANTASVAAASLRSPTEESVIVPTKGRAEPPLERIREDPAAIIIPPRFKLVFLSVLTVTVLAGLAEIVMASIWGTPTGLQGTVFSTMDFVVKAGFGAMVGLLGGKAS